MKIRKITSLTALLSFLMLFMTSIILYIVPKGRVAYWADWHFMGLTKTEWGNLHINLGFLFFISICFHIYFNWKPIVAYLKDKSKKLKIFTFEFNISLIFTIIFIVGTYLEAPPFIWIIDISDSIKEAAAIKYGEPPYGHAELSSLKSFTSKMGMDLKKCMEMLRKNGLTVKSPDQSLLDIAKINNITPKQVYLAMKTYEKKDSNLSLPDHPPQGFGNNTLEIISKKYNLNIEKILKILRDKGIKADSRMSIKTIAKKNNKSPIDIYILIKQVNESKIK